ncbi:BMC domain-containing protein [Terrisporobacter vanillatitrophus]|uniref:BMC domain-containing protein n=1 Tax=Terrisporobacter vanillatitrophus TaxID=3058402 RepID=UPI003365B381
MSQLAIGIIETIGLAAAIEAADVCLKSANISLIGYELTKGNGMTVVKIEGNVGAVKAAIEAASVAVNKVSRVYSQKVIPRPSNSIDSLIRNENTVGYENKVIEEIEEPKELLNPKEVEEEITDTPDLNLYEEDNERIEDEEEIEIEEEIEDTNLNDDNSESSYTCNLCKDAKCPRIKGDLRSACIHYDERKEK